MASEEEIAPGLTRQVFLDYAHQNQAGLTFMFVGISVLIYDYILTLEYEIRTVWLSQPRFSFAKTLFLLNRYVAFLQVGLRIGVEFSDHVWYRAALAEVTPLCSRYIWRQVLNWVVVANWLGIEAMLIMCIWALWNRSRWVGISLSAFTVVALVAALALQNVPPPSVAVLAPDWLFPCLAFSPVTRFWLYTFGSLIQIASFIMFLMKVTTLQAAHMSTAGGGSRIGSTLLQHCLLYYGCVMVLMGIGFASTLIQNLYIPFYTSQVLLPAMATICSRLGLALREILNRQPAGLTGFTYQTEITVAHDVIPPSYQRRNSWGTSRNRQRQQLDTLGMARIDSPDSEGRDHELNDLAHTQSPKTSSLGCTPDPLEEHERPFSSPA